MAADTINAISRQIGEALEPMRLLRSAHGRARLLDMLGYMPPPGIDDFGLEALDISPLLRALTSLDLSAGVHAEGSSVEIGLYADVFTNVRKTLDDIANIRQVFQARLPADYLAKTRIEHRLSQQLVDLLLISHIRAEWESLYDVLLLTGVFRVEPVEADPTLFRTRHAALSIAYGRIGELLSNPAIVLQSIGWGSPTFDASPLLMLAGELMRPIASSVRMRKLPGRVEARLSGVAPNASAAPLPQLLVSFEKGLGFGLPEFGVTAFGLRQSAAGASDSGIAFAPMLRNTNERSFTLAPGLDLSLDTNFDVHAGIVVSLRPAKAPTVQTGVTTGGAIGSSAGEILFRLVYQPPRDEATTLLKIPGGSRLEIGGLSVSAGLRAGPGGRAEFVIEAGLRAARFVLSLSEGSELLAAILPKDSMQATLDLGIGWAGGRTYLRGNAGLEATFPVHLSVGPVDVQTLTVALTPRAGGAIPIELSSTLRANLGPLTFMVERLGINAQFAFSGSSVGNLGPLDLNLGFKVPSGIGIALDAGLITGGGYLGLDPAGNRYAGVLQLKLPMCGVTAYGIYEQVQGRASFVAVLGIRFTPSIQLSFGFTLNGVGGLVGLNRRADVDLLRERLGSGAAGNVLFCEDPLRNAPSLLADLGAFFPPVPASFLVGPTLQIGWMSPLARFDLGIMIELPGPSKIVILGSARLMIGADEALALLYLRMDVLGCIDFDNKLIAFDAQLVGSHALGIFRLSGGMAFRLAYGNGAYILLSVGGFHPRFDPGPLKLPVVARVGASFDISVVVKVYLRLEMYLAFTSNTLQVGAKVEAGMQLGPLQAEGHFQFDALIQFQPFAFEADFSAGFSVRAFGVSLASVDIDGRVSGPGPVVVHARGSIRRLGIKVSGSATFEIGGRNADRLPVLASVVQALAPELSRAENLRAEGADATALPKPDRAASGAVLVEPRGALIWEQKRVPLRTLIDRFEGAQLDGLHELHLDGPPGWPAEDESDWFSPGRFSTLDTAASQTLNNATFQQLPSGIRIGLAADAKAPDIVSFKIEVELVKRPSGQRFAVLGVGSYLNVALAAMARERSVTPAVTAGTSKVSVMPETFDVYGSAGQKLQGALTPFQAFQQSRQQPGHVALPSTDEVLAL